MFLTIWSQFQFPYFGGWVSNRKKNVFVAAEMCLYWVNQGKKNWEMSDQPLNLVGWSLIASTGLASNFSCTENNLHIKQEDQTRCSRARDIYFTHSSSVPTLPTVQLKLQQLESFIRLHTAPSGDTKGFIALYRLLSNTFTHLCSYLHIELLTGSLLH